ncbi:MAG: SPOR domain-containing protein [Myxococcota bacterium]|nr:SPOR domain-containing protein [Myxococcota bacterium]
MKAARGPVRPRHWRGRDGRMQAHAVPSARGTGADVTAARRRTRSRSPGWAAVALVLVALPGFALGLIAGIIWEEPSLVARHLLGRTTDVVWHASAGDEAASEPLPDVAALPDRAPDPLTPARPAPSVTRMRPEVLTPGGAAGRFAVQVGAFVEGGAANRLADSLRAKGYEAYVSPGAGAGDARWRVRVGPLDTREDAERSAKRLKAEEKLPTWILDENGSG